RFSFLFRVQSLLSSTLFPYTTLFRSIGDSMAGSRIDPDLFTRLTSRRIAPLLYAGSGPAWWYLALKNWVIASGIHPHAVTQFFRDRKSTRLNSSHGSISYAVFCLKKR